MTETNARTDAPAEPATMDAQALADYVMKLPSWPWPGRQMSFEKISSGLTNVNWRMTSDDGEVFFVKVPGTGTRRYIDRSAAHEAAVLASRRGIGPGVLYYDDGSGIEVSEFLLGYRSATIGELVQPEMGVKLMHLYKELHSGELLPQTKTIFDMIDEHDAQIEQSDLELLDWQRDILEKWAPVQRAFLESGIDLVPGHNDMLPSNFMVGPDSELRLIDFDFAANTERTYELGGVLVLYPLSDDTREAMFHAYFGRPPSDRERTRVFACGVATCVKWGLWGLLSGHERPAEDFDFTRYGAMHLMNAARLLALRDTHDLVTSLRHPDN